MTARSKTAKTRAAPPPKRRRPPPTPPKRVRSGTETPGVMPGVKPRVMAQKPSNGSYFVSGDEKGELEFFSTGCAALDEVLGGGFCLGRTSNVVGDKSSGKTLLAMEAAANFCLKYPDGVVRYAEAEAAFDKSYAAALGLDLSRIEFNPDDQPMSTVEALYDDLAGVAPQKANPKEGEPAREGKPGFLDRHPGVPKLHIIDSLDSLSTEDEMDGDFNEASFGGGKPKAIGQLFRRLIGRLEKERCHFMVISQVRDVMNAKPFQQTKTRSGGKALDFYASWILWLTEVGKITREVAGIKRITGIDVKGQCRKNKIGLPWRTVQWPVLFGYGIDDMQASVDYLIENKCDKRLTEVGLSMKGHTLVLQKLRDKGGAEPREMRAKLAKMVHEEYARIETSFLPKASKY